MGENMRKHKCGIGNVVYIRSGGPSMTVCGLTYDPEGNPSVQTLWFDRNEKQCGGVFLEAWLEIIDDPPKRLG
jgi:uncharacterized protein YodC (DUF2158 family)